MYPGRMNESDARAMAVSDVRANMTEVIAEVRLLGRPVVLTRREKPQVVMVSLDFYERACRALAGSNS
jgi:prevent-host-death family protein